VSWCWVNCGTQHGSTVERGWGITIATDIAFVVGCLVVLGSRIPNSLRVMLLSLAIVDDIGAILVIAIGYTENLNLNALVFGLLGIVCLLGLMKLGVRNVAVYLGIALLIWFGFHESGHPCHYSRCDCRASHPCKCLDQRGTPA